MTAIGSHTPSTNSLWQRWYTVQDDATPTERRFNAWFAVIIPFGVITHAIFIMLFAYWEVWPMAVANVFSVLIWVLGAVVWRREQLSLAHALASALGSSSTSDVWRKERLSLVGVYVAIGSDKEEVLPPPPLLKTHRAPFNAIGLSISKALLDRETRTSITTHTSRYTHGAVARCGDGGGRTS
jgi:hypothetical protein